MPHTCTKIIKQTFVTCVIDHYVWLLKTNFSKTFSHLLYIKQPLDSLTQFYWANKTPRETEPCFIKQACVMAHGGQGNIISEKQTDCCIPMYFIVSTL